MFNCLNCNKLNPLKKNTYNKYCNNKCQKAHQRPSFDELKTDQSRRLRLFEHYGYSCQICNISEWQSKPLILELDHIDGDSSNNMWDNLRILCPNCHSQTPTYKAKNKGNGRKER